MSFTPGALPFGLRQVVLTPKSGAKVELAVAMEANFSPEVISGTLEGNDQVSPVDSILRSYTWSLNSGGLDFDARQVILGVNTQTAGSYPNVAHWTAFPGGAEMPYFRIDIRALATDGGDTWVYMPECKMTGLSEGAAFGEYLQPNFDGIAIADEHGNIAYLRTRETTIPLPLS